MMRTSRSDRPGFGRRTWPLGLSVVAVLCSLVLVAPATSAAKNPVSASVTVDPGCGFMAASDTWTPVPGQSFVGLELTDNKTLAQGRHALKATFTLYDAGLNPIVSDKANDGSPCDLITSLPT